MADYKAQLLDQKNKGNQLVFIHNQEKTDWQEKVRILSKEKHTYEIQLKEKTNENKSLQHQFSVDCKEYQSEVKTKDEKMKRLENKLLEQQKKLKEESQKHKSKLEVVENKLKARELCYTVTYVKL